MNSLIESMRQMFEMFQSMQTTAQIAAASPPAPIGPNMDSMIESMRQMFEMFQSMPPAPARAQVPPPAQAQNPMAAFATFMGGVQPPPGTIWVPGFGFVPLDRLMQAVGGGGVPERPGPYRAPPYRSAPDEGRGEPYDGRRGPTPPYGPPGRLDDEPPPPPPPPLQKTAAEQFREALGVVRSAVQAVQDINAILPNGSQSSGGRRSDPDEEDSPIKIIDTGQGKLVINAEDGSLRGWETGWANMDKVLRWVGEQREAIQQRHQEPSKTPAERPKQRQLPPGYVEMTPGYQPPPGYVAVPVDPDQIPGSEAQFDRMHSSGQS